MGTMDLAATFLDFAKATKPPGMTSVSLRSLLQGDDKSTASYRSFVSSGLQSMPFSDPVPDGGFAWRMVVEAETGLKFICCKGPCNGAPHNAPPVDKRTGFQQI